MKVAIIGAGISGLTTAYMLRQLHEIDIFEADSEPGGHARTVEIHEPNGVVRLDVGFMVYNETTYKGFSGLLNELDIPSQSSLMSFGMSCRNCNLEYGTGSPASFLAQGIRAITPSRLELLRDLRSFYADAKGFLRNEQAEELTLGGFLEARRYTANFRKHVIAPLVGAVWSAPASSVLDYPARYLFSFMANHKLLSFRGRRSWRTITGGSDNYVKALIRQLPNGVRINTAIQKVKRFEGHVELSTSEQWIPTQYDAVILACHSDQALEILTDADQKEASALKSLRYSSSRVVLHSDPGLMPRKKAAWSSWNVTMQSCSVEPGPARVTYYLNRLQQLSSASDYFVSLNPSEQLKNENVIQEWVMSHPIYDKGAVGAQETLAELNGNRRTFFVGSYLGHGFHEDGFRSAVETVRRLKELQLVLG